MSAEVVESVRPSLEDNNKILMTKIIGNNDGPNDRNESYKIGSRSNVPRVKAVQEVLQGKHQGAHVISVNGRRYVRDNPDHSKRDNVNRNKR